MRSGIEKKSGEVFPLYLRLSTIYDSSQKPCFYAGLFSDITRLKQTEEQLQELAFSDPLTKLPNRALFHQRMKQALKECRRHDTKLALLFIDLDRFKTINDTLGHAGGDRLLMAVGERIKRVVREMDTVARIGGDEFTVIISDLEEADTVTDIANKILSSVITPIRIYRHEIITHLSIGISLYPKDGQTVDDLIRHADRAMYQAKSEGGDRFHYFLEEMNVESGRRLILENEMCRGISSGQFVPYFEPIYDLMSGDLVGMEMLPRWQHPDRGLIMPDDFIPLAEKTGLIFELGRHLLSQACHQVRQWADQFPQDFSLAVTLSPLQFNSVDLVDEIEGILEDTGLQPHCLILEITESMLMGHIDSVLARLYQLHAIGLGLVIDDFGMGYSSLKYLQRFPVNALKIDRSFIENVVVNRNSQAIVRAIVSMAEAMELEVIAKGVESVPQRDFLKTLSCQKVQGDLFSKPIPAAQFRGLLYSEEKTI